MLKDQFLIYFLLILRQNKNKRFQGFKRIEKNDVCAILIYMFQSLRNDIFPIVEILNVGLHTFLLVVVGRV
jgi:hypothetical protein